MSARTHNDDPATRHAASRLARLAAVQALYQAHFGEETPLQIVRHMVDSGFADLRSESGSEVLPDVALFGSIVEGVETVKAALDDVINGALDKRLSAARLEILLRSIVRAGLFELQNSPAIPHGIIINDYVTIARAFYDGKEPGLVNGVLDRLAGLVRS